MFEQEDKLIIEKLQRALASRAYAIGDGPAQLEEAVKQWLGVSHCKAVSSGTAALHLALLAVGVKPGDMVVIPNLTFIATAHAVLLAGGVPALVDVDNTLTMDPISLNAFLGYTKTRVGAIMPVAYGGQPADITRIERVAIEQRIPIVYDAAPALGSIYHEELVGQGRAVCFSLNGNKIFTGGAGGLFCSSDATLASLVERRASHDRYLHTIPGFNYRLPNINALIALAQFKNILPRLNRKHNIWWRYKRAAFGHHIQDDLTYTRSNKWAVLLRHSRAAAVVERLQLLGVPATRLGTPMSLLPSIQANCVKADYLSRSIDAYNQVVCLPSSVYLTYKELDWYVSRTEEVCRELMP